MRNLLRVSTALALALVLALPGLALAAPVYHGTWDTENVCGGVNDLSGNWNVTLQADGRAVVHVAIFIEGTPHAFWGGNAFGTPWIQQEPASGEVFSLLVGLATPFGPLDLTFVLDEDGLLTYDLGDYRGSGLPAQLFGHLTH